MLGAREEITNSTAGGLRPPEDRLRPAMALLRATREEKTWVAGPSPAMTRRVAVPSPAMTQRAAGPTVDALVSRRTLILIFHFMESAPAMSSCRSFNTVLGCQDSPMKASCRRSPFRINDDCEIDGAEVGQVPASSCLHCGRVIALWTRNVTEYSVAAHGCCQCARQRPPLARFVTYLTGCLTMRERILETSLLAPFIRRCPSAGRSVRLVHGAE
jgi:hypothetical protein